MFNKLFPDIYIDSVFELPLDIFEKNGVRALFFDIDNTLETFDKAEPGDKIAELFEELKSRGFIPCLLSNNNEKRIELFNKKLKSVAVHKSGKPSSKKLKLVMKKLNVSPKESAVIGDQIFTDVLCANLAGAVSVLVAPVAMGLDEPITKIKRPAEKILLKRYFRKNGIKGHY